MTATTHAMAPAFIPGFLPGPDGSDPLFTVVIALIIILLMAVGNLYLKLHSLPERLAHSQSNTQLQIITALALLALFTHNNLFWVCALLLAVVRWPDFATPLNSIAESLRKLSADSTIEEISGAEVAQHAEAREPTPHSADAQTETDNA